jgi:putative DNA primase/helicase
MTRPAILERLRGVQRAGTGWVAFCPSHRDETKRSLSVSFGDDGRTLVHCFVGCATETVCTAVNMSLADLAPPANNGAARRRPLTVSDLAEAKALPLDFLHALGVRDVDRGVVIEYRLRDGRPAARHRLRTSAIAGAGFSWLGDRGDGPLVPYGLPHLDLALERGELLIVEGESDTWAGLYHHVPTLGVPGADMVKVLEAEHLTGIEALYLVKEPDRGGETFVRRIAERLSGIGWRGQLRVLMLPCKDLADLHVQYGDRFAETLAAAQRAAEPIDLAAGVSVDSSATTDGPVLISLAEVMAEPVEWLWPGRIARGKLTLIIGEPGEGKSYMTHDLAARATCGLAWPDGGVAPAGPVIILASEDGIADTVRPRVDRQGGDPQRIYVLRAVRTGGQEIPFTLEANLPALEQALTTTQAIELIIDPVSAYLGSKDSYKDAEIRGVLSPLAALAERYRLAVVGVLHLTKAAQRRLLLRAQGSVAFVAQARTVLAVGQDPDTPGRRLLVPIKNNLGAMAPALAFHIGDDGLRWESISVDVAAAERLLAVDEPATRSERRERDDAAMFLRDLLRDGPVASKQVESDAKGNGISQRTLWRAKAELGIVAERARTAEGNTGAWFWMLPVKP